MAKTNSYFKVDNISLDDYRIKVNGKLKFVSLFSNSYEKFVFFAIERFGNNSEAFPSQSKLAQVLLCSKSQIEKTIKKLKDKGLISIIKKPNRKTNTYETCNLEEKYLEVFGPQYKPDNRIKPAVSNTINKELDIKNNNKITSKVIDDIIIKTNLKINNQTKKNILNLTALKGICVDRLKEVINYVAKWNKGIGFLYKALRDNWILKDRKILGKTVKSIKEEVIKMEVKLNIKEEIKMNENIEIILSEDEEKKALIIAKKEGLSFEFLESMKKRAISIYIRTLKSLLNKH